MNFVVLFSIFSSSVVYCLLPPAGSRNRSMSAHIHVGESWLCFLSTFLMSCLTLYFGFTYFPLGGETIDKAIDSYGGEKCKTTG